MKIKERLQSFPVLLLAFYSGFYCLVIEVVWSRYLQLVFGVSVYAVATVIACFMLGLAAGNFLFGAVCDKVKDQKRLALMIIGMTVFYGFLTPLLYQSLQWLNHYFSAQAFISQTGVKEVFRILFSILFLIVPTSLLGGLTVVLVRIYNQNIRNIGRDAGVLYAANTVGSAMGAFLAGFVLVRYLGLQASIWLANGLFLFTTVYFYLSTRARSGDSAGPIETIPDGQVLPAFMTPVLLVCYGLSGLTSLAYEVFWTKILVLFFRDTVYDFAVVLTTFLIGLFIGSTLCSVLLRRMKKPVAWVAVIEFLIGISALAGLFSIAGLPYYADNIQSMKMLYQQFGGFYWPAAVGIRFAIAALIMLVPTILFGFTLPLISRLLINNPVQTGRKYGLITGLNTIGSTLGSLLAGFVMIALLGIRNSLVTAAAVNIIIGAGLLIILPSRLVKRRKQILSFMLAVSVLALFALPKWDRLRMSTRILENGQEVDKYLQLKYYHEDAAGITSVSEFTPTGQRFLSSGRIYVQNTSGMTGFGDHRRLGYIPLLLHPDPVKALVVGLGAGMTLNGVAENHIPLIDCVEISKGVAGAARYFGDLNNYVLDRSNIRLAVEDGRNFIATTPVKYDVIIADIFFPMSAGSSDLFTSEYFSLCRGALAPGGLFCQWLPAHQLSLDGIKLILRTFKTVFPEVSVWIGMAGESVPVIGLIGSDSPFSIDLNRLKARFAGLDQRALDNIELRDPMEFLSFYVCDGMDTAEFTGGSPVNTDDHPLIEFMNPLFAGSYEEQGRDNMEAVLQLRKDVFRHVKR